LLALEPRQRARFGSGADNSLFYLGIGLLLSVFILISAVRSSRTCLAASPLSRGSPRHCWVGWRGRWPATPGLDRSTGTGVVAARAGARAGVCLFAWPDYADANAGEECHGGTAARASAAASQTSRCATEPDHSDRIPLVIFMAVFVVAGLLLGVLTVLGNGLIR
jgi:hypothetical protein